MWRLLSVSLAVIVRLSREEAHYDSFLVLDIRGSYTLNDNNETKKYQNKTKPQAQY